MNSYLTLSNINWPLIKDIFSIIGTIGALIIGSLGLSTWRRQLRGNSEYILAKNAILKTYEIENALQNVRNPILHLRREEIEAGRKLEEEMKIYQQRLASLDEKWGELQSIRHEVKAIWSENGHNSFNEIHKCIQDLKSAVWLHFWMKGAYAGPGATIDNNPERVRTNNEIIYFISNEDEFSKTIAVAVGKIETYFRPTIRAKYDTSRK